MPAPSGPGRGDRLPMPTATATSSRSARKGTKRASRKAPSRRVSSAARARRVTRKAAPAKATRATAARARAASQTRAAVHQAETATRLTLPERSNVLGDYAERAVLIPVGAALTARDRVVSSVNGTIARYSTPTKAQAQLRRFDRRGATA